MSKMLPRDYLRNIIRISERREIPYIKTDPIGNIVKKGGHPSPTQIREYRGEDTVKPLILSDAFYFLTRPRRTDEPELLHPVNTETRPTFWNLGYVNEPSEIPTIYSHDWSERKALGGNYAILRLVIDTEVFGPKYEGTANALTNFRGTLFGQLKDSFRDHERWNPRPADVVKYLKALKAGISLPAFQSREYRKLARSVDAYKKNIPKLGWSTQDQEEVIELLRVFKARITDLQADLLPNGIIKNNSEIFFEDLARHARSLDSLVDDPNCIRHTKENPLMHNLNHLQYSGREGSYLESLVSYAIQQTDAGNQLAHVSPMVKVGEAADNIRKEGVKTAYASHIAYDKAINVAHIVGDRYLAHLESLRHPQAKRFSLALTFLKSELLKRVVGDYEFFSIQPDSDLRDRAPWVANQFERVRDYVGVGVEHYMLEDLEKLRTEGPSEREMAESLLNGYKRLIRKSVKKSGKGLLARIASFI